MKKLFQLDIAIRFLKRVVTIAIIEVTVFPIICLLFQYITGSPPPDALIYSVTGVWNGELILSAIIKIVEIKKETNNEDTTVEGCEEEDYE